MTLRPEHNQNFDSVNMTLAPEHDQNVKDPRKTPAPDHKLSDGKGDLLSVIVGLSLRLSMELPPEHNEDSKQKGLCIPYPTLYIYIYNSIQQRPYIRTG